MTESPNQLSAATANAAGIPSPIDSEHQNENAMPPKVAKAVSAVMADITKLEYSGHNNHGDYDFATIDDFLEGLRPKCAKHGLIISQDEESFDLKQTQNAQGKSSTWLIVKFRFTLVHSSGETWVHRPARTIMVNAAMGAQAFGAAQSYTLKMFMRALFQIATGEADVDGLDDTAKDTGPKKAPARTDPRAGGQHEVGAFTLYDAFGVEVGKFEKPEDFLTALVNNVKDNSAWFVSNENDVDYIEKHLGTQIVRNKDGTPRADGLTIAKCCRQLRKLATPPQTALEAG